jgi:hypothetical protein
MLANGQILGEDPTVQRELVLKTPLVTFYEDDMLPFYL